MIIFAISSNKKVVTSANIVTFRRSLTLLPRIAVNFSFTVFLRVFLMNAENCSKPYSCIFSMGNNLKKRWTDAVSFTEVASLKCNETLFLNMAAASRSSFNDCATMVQSVDTKTLVKQRFLSWEFDNVYLPWAISSAVCLIRCWSMARKRCICTAASS